MADEPPASLKAIKKFLEVAKRFRAADPVVAYHCRLFAMQEAMDMRAKIPKDDMGFVITLMDQLESEKAALGEFEEPSIAVENFALTLFERADDADRARSPSALTTPKDLQIAKDFKAAAEVLQTCKQFGEVSEDLLEKIKYANWRFVEICKAAKEKRPPEPPRGDPIVRDQPPPPPPGGEDLSSGGVPPPPPAADYLGLPPVSTQPAVPPVVPPTAPPPIPGGGHPPAIPGGYPASPPPAYAAVPPAVPAVPSAPGVPPPESAAAALPAHAANDLGRAQIMEAMKLCQSAISALQFQDAETAVHTLHKALSVLTTPQPLQPP